MRRINLTTPMTRWVTPWAPAPAPDDGVPVMAARKPVMVGRTAGPTDALRRRCGGHRAGRRPSPAARPSGGRRRSPHPVPSRARRHRGRRQPRRGLRGVRQPARPAHGRRTRRRTASVWCRCSASSTAASTRSAAPQPLRYLFDITGHVQGGGSDVKVDLLPIEGLTQPSRGAAAAPAVQGRNRRRARHMTRTLDPTATAGARHVAARVGRSLRWPWILPIAATGLGWMAVLALSRTNGDGHLHHLLAIGAMAVAMMSPLALPVCVAAARSSLWRTSTRCVVAAFAAFIGVWIAAGAVLHVTTELAAGLVPAGLLFAGSGGLVRARRRVATPGSPARRVHGVAPAVARFADGRRGRPRCRFGRALPRHLLGADGARRHATAARRPDLGADRARTSRHTPTPLVRGGRLRPRCPVGLRNDLEMTRAQPPTTTRDDPHPSPPTRAVDAPGRRRAP